MNPNSYEGGIAAYLEVLTAQTALLANQRTQVELLERRMTSSVLLIKALGGGWNAPATCQQQSTARSSQVTYWHVGRKERAGRPRSTLRAIFAVQF